MRETMLSSRAETRAHTTDFAGYWLSVNTIQLINGRIRRVGFCLVAMYKMDNLVGHRGSDQDQGKRLVRDGRAKMSKTTQAYLFQALLASL